VFGRHDEERAVKSAMGGWRPLGVLLATAYVAHALYFDWSDVLLHISLALVALFAAFKWPRASTATLAMLLLVVIVTSRRAQSEWALVAQPGQNWAALGAKLGTPHCEAASLLEARACATGLALPSPPRFRHVASVAVYVRGDEALWIFHNDRDVIDRFVGGT